MDLTTLKMLLQTTVEVLKAKLPAWAYGLLKGFLDTVQVNVNKVTLPAGDAPDFLKAWFKAFLLDQIREHVQMAFVQAILVRVVEAMDGMVLDYIWDLLAAKLAGGSAPLMMTAPRAVAIDLDDIVAAYAA